MQGDERNVFGGCSLINQNGPGGLAALLASAQIPVYQSITEHQFDPCVPECSTVALCSLVKLIFETLEGVKIIYSNCIIPLTVSMTDEHNL